MAGPCRAAVGEQGGPVPRIPGAERLIEPVLLFLRSSDAKEVEILVRATSWRSFGASSPVLGWKTVLGRGCRCSAAPASALVGVRGETQDLARLASAPGSTPPDKLERSEGTTPIPDDIQSLIVRRVSRAQDLPGAATSVRRVLRAHRASCTSG